MRALLAIILLCATAAEAQRVYPLALPRGCRDRSCVRERAVVTSPGFAFFEFAPISGTGMGAACACATPTGAKGEAMTFTRGSSATCLKTVGTAPQAIANGDMVTCASNQPRVMPGADGTGVNGLLVEGARMNSTLQSEAQDNAAWGNNNNVVALPVIVADQATAPNGTLTADRITVPVSTGGNYSQHFQTGSCPAGVGAVASASLFVKGVSGSGTFDIVMSDATTKKCVACAYNSTSWSLCKLENTTFASGSGLLAMGSLAIYSANGCTGAAADVYVWGAQCEAGAYATSYIATTSAAVTRSAEAPSFAIAAGKVDSAGSVAATIVTVNTSQGGILNPPVNSPRWLYFAGNQLRVADNVNPAVGVNATYPGVLRGAAMWSGSSETAFNITAGTSNSGTFAGSGMMASSTTFQLGTNTGVAQLDGVIKQVCVDPSPSRCR